jgi:hypothetical protein
MMKRSVKYGLVLLIILNCGLAKAQYYSKRFPLLSKVNGYISSIQIVEDTIYAMGYIGDSLQPANSIAIFSKYDKNANVISRSTFSIPNRYNIGVNQNTLIRTNDGGFAFGGYTNGTTQNENALLIVKYDRNGDFQWDKEIPDTNSIELYCWVIVQDSSSNYYLTGALTHPSNDEDIYIAKTDSLGNPIYFKTFNNPNTEDIAQGLTFNEKGHLLLGGSSLKYNSSGFSTAKTYTRIYELDTNGNQLNMKIGIDTNGPPANNIIITSDGGFLTASVYTCKKSTNFIYGQGCITKFDSNYNEIWRIDVGSCSIWTGFDLQIGLKDNNYLAVGSWCAPDDTNMLHVTGFIVKYSGDGHIIWSRQYKGVSDTGLTGDFNEFTSCGVFSDQSILCSGESTDNGASINGQQGWLLHLDTAGCLPDSNTCGIVDAVTDIQRANGSVKVYPNPASDMLTMECRTDQPSEKSIQVVNMLGQIMYSNSLSAQQAELSIDVKQWAAGVYSYKVISEKGFTSSGSFVVSH